MLQTEGGVRASVLISSAGRRVELLRLFQVALGEADCGGRVVAIDSAPFAPACFLADDSHQVSACSSPHFVDEVLSVCENFGVSLVIPTIDPELPVYALARDTFEQAGIRVVVSCPETVEVTGDKTRFHRFLVDHSLPTVAQTDSLDASEVLDIVGLPCVVKPRRGSSSSGVSIPSTPEQLAVAIRPGFIAQGVARGVEYTVDVFCGPGGRLLTAVPRKRIAVRGGEVSKGVVVDFPEVADLARAVVQALPGPYGALCVQIFHCEETSTLAVIEVNARFGGGFPLAAAAGADYSRYLVESMLGRTPRPLRWKTGITMLRYDESVFLGPDGRIL